MTHNTTPAEAQRTLAAQAHAAADAYDAAVARVAPRDRRVKRNDPFAAGGLLSELSVSHRADQD